MKTRRVTVGAVPIGGGSPISVQSMTRTDTRDAASTLAEIRALEEAGCDIVRVAVPDEEAAASLSDICRESPLPVVADIHFDHRLALLAVRSGVHKLRLNPGNLRDADKVVEVVRAAKSAGIPIRVGVNAGSLDRRKEPALTPEAMVRSAEEQIAVLEREGFRDTVVALKASSVRLTVDANRLFASRHDYPLHLGVTEAGTVLPGTVKSAAALSILLSEGIGDTIRVSLCGSPLEEVRAGRVLLRALGIRREGVDVIACPVCGRCGKDGPGSVAEIVSIAEELDRRTRSIRAPVKAAVMGCEVNGPGEAKECDIGVALTRGGAVLFRRGRPPVHIERGEILGRLVSGIEEIARESGGGKGR